MLVMVGSSLKKGIESKNERFTDNKVASHLTYTYTYRGQLKIRLL